MKRFFKRKNKRSQSTEGDSGGVGSHEEQPFDPTRTATPSVVGSKQNNDEPTLGRNENLPEASSVHEPEDVQKNGTSSMRTAPSQATSKMQPGTLSEVTHPVSTQSLETTSTKASSANSSTLRQAIEKSSDRSNIGNSEEEAHQNTDTDSDDAAGLLSSKRTEYKGVSSSFRGLNATEQFEKSSHPDPDGRIASISNAYDSIPLIEQTKLPRGGISMETKAIGRIQVRQIQLNCSFLCLPRVASFSHIVHLIHALYLLVWHPTRDNQR
jgi:hypothetical protein